MRVSRPNVSREVRVRVMRSGVMKARTRALRVR